MIVRTSCWTADRRRVRDSTAWRTPPRSGTVRTRHQRKRGLHNEQQQQVASNARSDPFTMSNTGADCESTVGSGPGSVGSVRSDQLNPKTTLSGESPPRARAPPPPSEMRRLTRLGAWGLGAWGTRHRRWMMIASCCAEATRCQTARSVPAAPS